MVPNEESLLPPHKKNSSLRASVRDGMCTSVMTGVGETYLGTFAIFLQGSPLQVGALATLPPFFGSLCQALGVWLLEHFRKRRILIVGSAIAQALIWLPIALIPYIWGSGEFAVSILIVLTLLYWGAISISSPIWNSLIGDLVPAESRGAFFGIRNQWISVVTIVALILAGTTLQITKSNNATLLGFTILFATAGIARLLSAYFLSKHEDKAYHSAATDYFNFAQFIRRTRHSNYVKFVFFFSFMNFSISIIGPYFAVYMLRDLHFSYLQFTIITATAIFAQLLTMQGWGKLADQVGSKKILTVCAIGTTTLPFLWLVSANFFYILVIQTLAGFLWAGYNLSASNFLFDAVSPPKRARCFAYQSIISSFFAFSGSLLGGYLMSVLPADTLPIGLWIPASPVIPVLILSGFARIFTVSVILRSFKEVRAVEFVRNRDVLFRVAAIRPISGITLAIHDRTTGARLRKPQK